MTHFSGLTLALSKGRILKQTLPLLASAGIEIAEQIEQSRKLVFASVCGKMRILVVRPSDVPTYVEYGAADLGITGKDTLLEFPARNLYELLDLKIARCRLMVAARENAVLPQQHIRVASKYVQSASAHFAAQGRQAKIIKLYGAMELAPMIGLSDCIVDLVDTGSTLKANGLVAIELIREISARLVVNQAAYKLKNRQILPVLTALSETVSRQH